MKYTSHILLIALMVATAGCAGYAADEALGLNGDPGYYPDDSPGEAPSRLAERDIVGARDGYAATLENNPANGPASAGHAVTSLLLSPYSNASTELITGHLGARAALDAQGDVIYGDQGLMYFIARGVPWEDGESAAGIKTLLSEKLPWSLTQLDSVDGFVSGLRLTADLMAEDLTALANELGRINDDINVALDDPVFARLELPGTVFHDESLMLSLGRSELAAVGGVIGAARAGLYFFSAYDHGWTLERAFGSTVWEEVIANPADVAFVDGYVVADYQLAHLNESAGRSIGNAARLADARDALRESIDFFVLAIEEGLTSETDDALIWSSVKESTAEDVITLLEALADSLEGPTQIPFTEPALSMNLAPLFIDGRTVPEELSLFRLDTYENEFGATVREIAVDEATLEVVLEGIFTPEYGTEPGPELLIAEDISTMIESATETVATDYERTVSSSF